MTDFDLHPRILPTIAALALALALAMPSPVAAAGRAEALKRQAEMLQTVVKIVAVENDAGQPTSNASGIVIHSAASGSAASGSAASDGACKTLILTAHHVVEPAIKAQETPKPTLRAIFYDYRDGALAVGTRILAARLAAVDGKRDLALLVLLDDSFCASAVAALLPEGDPLFIAEDIFAVGAGSGLPPFITAGLLGPQDISLGAGRGFSTAPLVGGNSGGGLFHLGRAGRYELIGVAASIGEACCTHTLNPLGGPPLPGAYAVAHLAWSVRMDDVRAFLNANDFGFVLPPPATAERQDP